MDERRERLQLQSISYIFIYFSINFTLAPSSLLLPCGGFLSTFFFQFIHIFFLLLFFSRSRPCREVSSVVYEVFEVRTKDEGSKKMSSYKKISFLWSSMSIEKLENNSWGGKKFVFNRKKMNEYPTKSAGIQIPISSFKNNENKSFAYFARSIQMKCCLFPLIFHRVLFLPRRSAAKTILSSLKKSLLTPHIYSPYNPTNEILFGRLTPSASSNVKMKLPRSHRARHSREISLSKISWLRRW